MKVQGITTQQGTDISKMLNDWAGEYADSFLGVLIAESKLNEQALREGKWPDYSAGLSQVIAANLGYGSYAREATDAEKQAYRNLMFMPLNAVMIGWKYYEAALRRMDYDPQWAALSFNRGPSYSRAELEEQVRSIAAIRSRYERYKSSLEQANPYAVTQYVVGPGVQAKMDEYGDEPRSNENFRLDGISETFGRDAVYYYIAEDNRTNRVPFEA
jgi:hypothetical protein